MTGDRRAIVGNYAWWALVGSIAAIAIVLGAIGCVSFVDHETWAWSSLSPNAWGDLLAGTFAPAAFVLVSVGFWANAQVTALHSRMLQVQTETAHTAFLMSVHREFVDLMEKRILVWREFADPKSKVGEESETYAEFWLTVAFFQRLALLIERNTISAQEAGAILSQNAWWWYVHFFDHPRCQECGASELNRAKKAWELIKPHATKDQLAEWSKPAMEYGDPKPLPAKRAQTARSARSQKKPKPTAT